MSKHVNIGLCYHCGKKHDNVFDLCDDCLEKGKAYVLFNHEIDMRKKDKNYGKKVKV